MRHAEHEIQSNFVTWCRRMARLKPATHGDLDMFFAIPNGAALRSGARAGKWLKDEGRVAGIPDMMLPAPGWCHSVLWIEFKAPKGRLNNAQKSVHERLHDMGHMVAVCRSVAEAIAATEEYLHIGK